MANTDVYITPKSERFRLALVNEVQSEQLDTFLSSAEEGDRKSWRVTRAVYERLKKCGKFRYGKDYYVTKMGEDHYDVAPVKQLSLPVPRPKRPSVPPKRATPQEIAKRLRSGVSLGVSPARSTKMPTS